MAKRITLRLRVLLFKIVILPLLVLSLAWGGQRLYFLVYDQAAGVVSPMNIFLLMLVPLLAFAVIDLLVYAQLSKLKAQHVQDFAVTIRQGEADDNYFPELGPIVDAYREKERQLQRETNKIVWIVGHIPGGLLTINREETITLAACPAFEQLGLPVNSLLGKPVSAFHDLLGLSRSNSPLIDALQRGVKSRRISLVKDHYFEAVNAPMINDAGELNGAVCLFVDVTERVRQEQEMKRLERLSLVGQMAASLSHEIRNPLTVIRGYLQLHANKMVHSPVEDHFQLLIEEIDRVSQIVQEFLSLSHSGGGEWYQMSLSQLVGQLSPLLSSEAAIHGISLHLNLLETPELLLNCGDIKQLLLNLYRNAIEACDGSGNVQISTGVGLDRRPYLRVQDDGCGMPNEVLERLGTPFNSTKENGTGLGLPLCLSVAEGHGAKLTFQPCPIRGTVATVLFPALDELLVSASNN